MSDIPKKTKKTNQQKEQTDVSEMMSQAGKTFEEMQSYLISGDSDDFSFEEV